jgi:hypothetical protein
MTASDGVIYWQIKVRRESDEDWFPFLYAQSISTIVALCVPNASFSRFRSG